RLVDTYQIDEHTLYSALDPYRDQVAYKKDKPEVQFLVVPGFGKVEHQFLIEGKGEITLKYESRHGGKLAKTIKLE
ncbi:MAG: hypothetical protein IMZ50_17225, partial [Candidatus Atribacteria bacterium]|nr:hypothetical protein [Candidatus Atribacteria bacterium]